MGVIPIAYELNCLLPYPSDVFLKNGRITVTGPAQIQTFDGEFLEMANMESDGFPIYPNILFKIARPITQTQLKQVESRILNTKTNENVPHIAELYLEPNLPTQFVALRPSIRLDEDTRYIVSIGTLKDGEGQVMEPPRTFVALRDNGALPPHLSDMRRHYKDAIFPNLQAVGIERDSVYLAWDFTTRSRSDVAGEMLTVRELTLAWLESNAVELENIRADRKTDGQPALVIHGAFQAPMFVDDDAPGAVLRRDSSGRPTYKGTITVPFRVHVPRTVLMSKKTVNLLQFGHGFFGTCDEVLSGVQVDFAEDRGYAMACVDWVGMTTSDGAHVLTLLAVEPERTFTFIERVYQAMANQLTFTPALRALAQTPVGQFSDGTPMWSDNIQFLGISQGHILGGIIAALSPAFTRTVLHVGGGPFSLIMTRSVSFSVFDLMLRSHVIPEEALKFQAFAPTALEHIDPIAYAPMVLQQPLDGNPKKQILLQAVLGDSQVPNIASEAHAAALGIPILSPSPRPPILGGLTHSYPTTSGLVYFDVGIPYDWADLWREVPGQNEAHDGLRATPEAREQWRPFGGTGLSPTLAMAHVFSNSKS